MSILKKIFSGDSRTALVKKNIAGSFLIKGWNSLVQLLLVPATLQCLSQYEYGIWLTISSILLWIDQFDIGLGNGLRNKLAESLANKDFNTARKLISTTFLMSIIIIIPLTLFLLIIIEHVDCYAIFNTSPTFLPHLNSVLNTIVVFVGATFIFKIIGNVYLGMQMPAINNLLVAIGRTLSLVCIVTLAFFNEHSFKFVAIAYTISPLAVYLFFYPITFHFFKKLRPSFFCFDRIKLREILSLGIKFFFVQISGAVIFASSNLIISNVISPESVTPYQVTYYYFSIPLMLFTIIITPIWSATTDAYTKGDYDWIHRMERQMKRIVLYMIAILIIMVIVSPIVYRIWLGEKIAVNIELSIGMAIYMSIIIFSLCYSTILFGIGKLRLLTIITLFEAMVFVPLAYSLSKHFGIIGIVAALTIVNSLCAITNYIQLRKISTNQAYGIWNK